MEDKSLDILEQARCNCDLLRLDQVAAGMHGAARLVIRATFEPERCITLEFKSERINVEIAGGESSRQRDLLHEAGSVHYDNAPEPMASWDEFVRLAGPLPSTARLLYDGTRYAHGICVAGKVTGVTWLNPSWIEFPRQMLVIRSYLELAEAAGLKRLIKMLRAGSWR